MKISDKKYLTVWIRKLDISSDLRSLLHSQSTWRMEKKRKRANNKTISHPLRFRWNKPRQITKYDALCSGYWNMYESISGPCRQDNEWRPWRRRGKRERVGYTYIFVWSFELLFKVNHRQGWEGGRAGLSFLLYARRPGVQGDDTWSCSLHHISSSRVPPLSCFTDTRCCSPVITRDRPDPERWRSKSRIYSI